MLPRLCGSEAEEAEPECDDALISLLLQEVLSLPPNLGKINAQGWSKIETFNALHLEKCNSLKHVMLLTLKHEMLPTVHLETCNAVKHIMLFTLKHCNAADIHM